MWEAVGLVAVVAVGIIVAGWALYACFKTDKEAKEAELEAYTEAYEHLKRQPGVKVLSKTGALILPMKKEQDEE